MPLHFCLCTAGRRPGRRSSSYLPVVWVEGLRPWVAVGGRVSLQKVATVRQLELHLSHAGSILQVHTTLLMLLHLQCSMAPVPVCNIIGPNNDTHAEDDCLMTAMLRKGHGKGNTLVVC